MYKESPLVYHLWLIIALKPANMKINRLLEYYKSPAQVFLAPIDDVGRVAQLGASDIQALEEERSLVNAQKILDKCNEEGISICTIYDEIYPKRFLTVPNPPTLFFYRGNPIWDDAPLNIAIVGTRRMTQYGYKVTKELASDLAMCGCVIVSGMAEGVDFTAQDTALKSGGKTIAFLGGGIDVIYPQNNMILYYDIIDGGCIISEFLPGERNLRHHFQIRNRLIAAMSDGVLITQAPKISGALITAKWAAEFNRDVFAVPGNIDESESEGANSLIRDGAKLVSCKEDVLSEFRITLSEYIKNEKPKEQNSIQLSSEDAENEKIKKIIFLLKDADYDCSSLASLSEISISELIFLLTDLQIKGIITEKPGGIYALSGSVLI